MQSTHYTIYHYTYIYYIYILYHYTILLVGGELGLMELLNSRGSLLALGTCKQPVISFPPTIMTHCPKLGGKSLGPEPLGIGPAQITSN